MKQRNNRLQSDSIDDNADDEDDIVNSVVTSVLRNNRRILESIQNVDDDGNAQSKRKLDKVKRLIEQNKKRIKKLSIKRRRKLE